ncbi:MAG: hypothetical protein WKF71_15615 [Pyrinomonadaceae bacterium]
MSLYGHEISDEITPLEANLGWICKLNTRISRTRRFSEIKKKKACRENSSVLK